MSTRMISSERRRPAASIEIRVKDNKVFVVPELLEVYLGETISVRVSIPQDAREHDLTLYFSNGTPFSWSLVRFDLSSGSLWGNIWDPSPPRLLDTTPITEGDYKYGVRLETKDHKVVDDEDPYIRVLPNL
jgi:hypothetical protein